MWEIFIDNRLYPTYIVEFLAATAGIVYLSRSKTPGKADKLLVFYLLFIFIFDLLAITYGLYGYVYKWEYLEFIAEPFRSIYWIYNILTLISATAYTLYFYLQLNSAFLKKILVILISIFLVSSILMYIVGNQFFTTTSSFSYIFASFLIFFSVIFYYFELLNSERLLNFRTELPLYISAGLLIYQLGITPLFIFQKYIRVSSDFRIVYSWILDFGNIFLYTLFVYGFIAKIAADKKAESQVIRR